jgi:hypothetical protein
MVKNRDGGSVAYIRDGRAAAEARRYFHLKVASTLKPSCNVRKNTRCYSS